MFDLVFMRLALVASIATGASLGVLGVYLAMRRVIFLGLIVANAATVGAAVASALGWAPETLSLATAVLAAAVLGGVRSSSRVSAESLMGWAYAAASSVTVLVLSWTAGGSADTLDLLFGNVLAVSVSDVVWLSAIAVAVGSMQLLFGQRLLLVTFDPETATVAGVNARLWTLALHLAVGVVAATAVEAIGALSTFALLALPSMAALIATTSVRATFVTAAGLGMIVPALALVLSFYLDLPAGPAAVALLAASVPIAVLVHAAASALR